MVKARTTEEIWGEEAHITAKPLAIKPRTTEELWGDEPQTTEVLWGKTPPPSLPPEEPTRPSPFARAKEIGRKVITAGAPFYDPETRRLMPRVFGRALPPIPAGRDWIALGQALKAAPKITEQVEHETGMEEVERLTGRKMKPRQVVPEPMAYKLKRASLQRELKEDISPRVRRAKEKTLQRIEETIRKSEEQQREIETLTPEERTAYGSGIELGTKRSRDADIIKVAIMAGYLGHSAVNIMRGMPAHIRTNKATENLLKRIETLKMRRAYPSHGELVNSIKGAYREAGFTSKEIALRSKEISRMVAHIHKSGQQAKALQKGVPSTARPFAPRFKLLKTYGVYELPPEATVKSLEGQLGRGLTSIETRALERYLGNVKVGGMSFRSLVSPTQIERVVAGKPVALPTAVSPDYLSQYGSDITRATKQIADIMKTGKGISEAIRMASEMAKIEAVAPVIPAVARPTEAPPEVPAVVPPEVARPPVTPPAVSEVRPPAVPPVAPEVAIPKELEPLAREARKYKSAEEFVKATTKKQKAIVDDLIRQSDEAFAKSEAIEGTAKAVRQNERYIKFGIEFKEQAIREERKLLNQLSANKLTALYNQATKPTITPPKPLKPAVVEPRKAVRVFEPMPLKPAKVKEQIREVSGQIKVSEIIQVSERKLLADQLRIARKSAREGAIAGRKEAVLKARRHIIELKEKSKIRRELRTETNQKIRQLNTFLKMKIHPDYDDQLHTFLGKYDLFRRQAKTIKRREDTRQFIARMEEQGETVYIPEDVLEKTTQIPLNDMSIDNLRDLHEQAKSIVHFGKLKNKLIAGLESRDFGRVKQSMIQSIRTNFPKAKVPTPPRMLAPSERIGRGFWGKRKKAISGTIDSYFAIHKKAEAIIESIDGYRPLGTFHQETFGKLAKAESKKDLLSRKLNQAVNDAFRYSGIDLLKADQLQDTIEGSDLTKFEQIAVYVNSLNPDNRDGLRAYGWSDEKIDKIVKNLTPKEKRLGDRLMRIVGAQRQQLFSIGEKLIGRRPKPIKNYWPKIYDLELSDVAIQKKIESDLFRDVIARAYVERGFLKHRVKLERPVSLNLLRVLSGHLEKTTHFISHALEVRDTQKLLYDPEIKAEITRTVGRQEYKQLVSWLKHIANPEKGSFDWWDKAAGRLRANSTLAMLGIKVAVSLKQGGSFTQTINRLGVKDATKGLVAFWKNPIKAQKFIYDRSTEMRFRRTKFDRELRDWVKQHRKGWTPSKRQFLFTGIITVDKVATLPSWLGAYIKGVRLFKGDEKRMVKYADMIARRTQPAASPKDLPAIQRGTNLHKIFTMFYTHFTNVYNETARTTGMMRQRKISKLDALVSYWWLLIAPAVFALYVSRPRKQTPKQVVKGIVGYGAAAFPIIGNLVNTMLNPQYDYTMTPVAQLPRELVAISKGKKLATKARHATLAAGYLFGLPTPQMLITGTGIGQILKGETRNPMRLFLSEWSLEGEKPKKAKKVPF